MTFLWSRIITAFPNAANAVRPSLAKELPQIPESVSKNSFKHGLALRLHASSSAFDGNTDEHRRQQYFLLKSEPSDFSISDLRTCPDGGTEEWDGVRNFEARNILRTMNVGDRAFFYHSNCRPPLGPGIVGTVRIVREAEPDATALDPDAKYYDPKSTVENCRWDSVKVQFEAEYPVVLTLKELKERAATEAESEFGNGVIGGMTVLKRSRLSVSRVTEEEWAEVEKMVEEKVARER